MKALGSIIDPKLERNLHMGSLVKNDWWVYEKEKARLE